MQQLRSAVGSEDWLSCRNRVIISSRSGPAAERIAPVSELHSVSRRPVAPYIYPARVRANRPDQPFRLFDQRNPFHLLLRPVPTVPATSSNPTSPCYSANAPRNPCSSRSLRTNPVHYNHANPQTSPPLSAPAAATSRTPSRAFTADQAKSQIEAEGY